VELGEATELLLMGRRVGYLLKGRVLDVEEFIDALDRILAGGSVVDSGLVREVMAARRVTNPLDALTPRERDVLELMAEGRSNAGIAAKMWLSEATVEKHVRHILAKLKLPPTKDDHRRVLAVITFLRSSKEAV
jgi:DNA-binding NarL/FixJ family response regulator